MKRFFVIFLSLFIFIMVHANDIYEVTATRLNVRTSPSQNASVIGGLSKGDLVEVTEIRNSTWASFEFKNKVGFASLKFLKFVRHIPDIVVETQDIEEVVEEVEDTVIVEMPVQHTYVAPTSDIIPTLLNGPRFISRKLDLYYGLNAGVGYSSFLWDGELANGTLTYTADLFAELDFNEKVGVIPKGYFTELQLGYDSKGAAWYPLNYVHARIYPFGYKLNLRPIKLGIKAGLYLGYPLSDLESYDSWEYWSGNFQIGVTGGIGIEYKQFGLYANVEYNFTEVASTPVTINNIALFGTISYKFGKLKH